MPANQLVLLAVAIVNLLLALLIYARNPRSLIHKFFSFSVFFIALWNISVIWLERNPNLFTANLTTLIGYIMGTGLFSFILEFPNPRIKQHTIYYLIILISSLLVLISAFSGLAIKDIDTITKPTFGPGYFGMMLYAVGLLSYTTWGTISKYKRSKGLSRMQMKYMFLGFFLFLNLTIITNVILPNFGISQFTPFGPLFSLIFVGFTAYAIAKHRLMDIRAVIAKSVSYSLLVVLIAGIFASLIFYIKQSYKTTVGPDILFVITGLVIALGFQPLRAFLEKHTDKIFAKRRYNPQELQAKLGQIATSTLKLKPLANEILKTMVSEMRIGKAALVLTGNTTVTGVKTVGYEKKSDLPWRKIIGLVSGSQILLADELEEESKDKCILRELEIALLLPLRIKKETVAILTLGEKRSGDMYTLEDIKFLEVLAPELAISIRNAELFKETEQRVVELNALNKMAISLTSTVGLENLLGQAIEQALIVTKAESGSIMLIDEKTQTLSIQAARGVQSSIIEGANPKVGEGIAGWVAETGEPLILVGAEDERFKEILRRAEILSALSVPLKAKDKVIGVLNVNRKIGGKIFTKEDLELVIAFAAQVAAAIENAKLYEDLENMVMGTISALASAVDAKDPYTYGHSQAVTEYAVATAKELALSQAEVETIRLAGTLHDIGKIGIESEVLNKPASLTAEERKLVNLHPVIGVDILKSLDFLKNTLPSIYYHHERWDGKGYPQGRKGKDIPIGARIIAVADAFNAMISDRPYRPAKSLEEAIGEIKVNAGSQFDPQVAQAFLRVVKRFHRDLDFQPVLQSSNHVRKP